MTTSPVKKRPSPKKIRTKEKKNKETNSQERNNSSSSSSGISVLLSSWKSSLMKQRHCFNAVILIIFVLILLQLRLFVDTEIATIQQEQQLEEKQQLSYTTSGVSDMFTVTATEESIGNAKPLTKQQQQQRKSFFLFDSGNERYNKAYKLAMDEMKENIVRNTFIAGAGWTQLWTRDTSYAIELGAGLVYPNISKKSLLKCESKKNVWVQDKCGHFGGWPFLSDAIVGVRGAWYLYTITGDKDFLQWAYDITIHSLEHAERDVYETDIDIKEHNNDFNNTTNNITGRLFKGCSSFMESNSGYPKKYKKNGLLVGKTKALSTNLLHYNGYEIAYRMAIELGLDNIIGKYGNKKFYLDDINKLKEKALRLRDAIRTRFWSNEKGYYVYLIDEYNKKLKIMEGLGESLVLLSNNFETSTKRIKSIFQNTYRTSYGIPCLWPQHNIRENLKDISSYYHNGRIWPFVQGYWSLAAIKHRQLNIFMYELESLVKLSEMNNTFAEFYELDGTFPIQRRRQLWSNTGFISMIYHGLFGMKFVPNGIYFNPMKKKGETINNNNNNSSVTTPLLLEDTISLTNVQYRNMILDIYVSGSGTIISSFQLDNIDIKDHFVPCNLTGNHRVDILLVETTK